MPLPNAAQQWSIPLSQTDITLKDALKSMHSVTAGEEAIPFIVQLAENPRFQFRGMGLFSGATDLESHDCIHLLLGRGIMPKDEAFVLGFTMGASKSMKVLEEQIYGWMARHLYPGDYRFSEDDYRIYKDAVNLAKMTDCEAFNEIDYLPLEDKTLGELREQLAINVDLLNVYYSIEQKRYPENIESQRLLN